MNAGDMTGSTSLSLIQRAVGQSAEAWDRLSQIYTPLVYQWCRHAGLQPHDAADVVQDTFRSLLSALPQFRRDRPGDSFRGWLWTIARSKIHDHRRSAARHAAAVGGSSAQRQLAELPDHSPEEDNAGEAQLVRADLARRAVSLMRQDFEERTWQAFWLTTVEEKSAAEAGEALGMSISAIYVAKSRVLRRLREELTGLEIID